MLDIFHTTHFPCVHVISTLGTHIDKITEIMAFYGSDLTKAALQSHMTRDITPYVRPLKDFRTRGEDPKDAFLIEGVPSGNPGKS